jgi:hypothetical protein
MKQIIGMCPLFRYAIGMSVESTIFNRGRSISFRKIRHLKRRPFITAVCFPFRGIEYLTQLRDSKKLSDLQIQISQALLNRKTYRPPLMQSHPAKGNYRKFAKNIKFYWAELLEGIHRSHCDVSAIMGFFEAFFGVLDREPKLVFNTAEAQIDSAPPFKILSRLKKIPLPCAARK